MADVQDLKSIRTKYPQYDHVDDETLVNALHKKYYSHVPIATFNERIGYAPAPIEPIVDTAQPVKPAVEALNQDAGYQAPAPLMGDDQATIEQDALNALAGAGERTGDIGAGYLKSMEAVSQTFAKYFVHGGDPRAEKITAAIFKKGIDALEGIDLGYEEKTNFEGVKQGFKDDGALSAKAWGNVLEYGLEQGVKSIPDMVAVVASLPQYVIARSGEMGTERAKNKGKEKAELVDILEATPFALGSALFERIGAKGMTSEVIEAAGRDMLKAGIKESVKRVAKAGGSGLSKEAATEAIQEGIIEYAGEKYGTDAQMFLQESIDRGLGGALAGGVMGGSVATTLSTAQEIAYNPEKAMEKSIEADLEAAEMRDPQEIAAEKFEHKVEYIRGKQVKDRSTAEMVLEKKATIIENKRIAKEKENALLDRGSPAKPSDQRGGSEGDGQVLSVTPEVRGEPDVTEGTTPGGAKAAPVGNGKPKPKLPLKETAKPKLREPSKLSPKEEAAEYKIYANQIKQNKWADRGSPVMFAVDKAIAAKKPLTERQKEVLKMTYLRNSERDAAVKAKDKKGPMPTSKVETVDIKGIEDVPKTKVGDNVEKFSKDLQKDLGLKSLSLYKSRDHLKLDAIIVDKSDRKQGKGTEAMNKIIEFADQNNLKVVLSPALKDDFQGTTSRKRLVKFYKRFGFKENKGRNKDFTISEGMIREPLAKAKPAKKTDPDVFQSTRVAPQAKYQPTYGEIGFPARPEANVISLAGKTISMPSEDKPIRREGIQTEVENIIGARLYHQKVKGGNVAGFYRRSTSEVRLDQFNDIETLSHEMAHYLDFHYKYKNRFNLAYKGGEYKSEVEALSYTDVKGKIGSEGFAEFVRLWLTQFNEAEARAPKFTKRFEMDLKKDPKLYNKMRKLQINMHKWFYQGDLARLNALTSGNQYTVTQRATKFLQQRPAELWRQNYIDHIHAAKVMTRTTKGELGDATVDPYKQLQLLNGIAGLFEESVKVGAPSLKADGDLEFIGPSLTEIWKKSINRSAKRLRQQEMYFVARRATELKLQGRENLITVGMIKEGLALANKFPYFKKAFDDYQIYNKNLMQFYVDTGYITAEASEDMQENNKNYVPFHRVSEGISEGYSGQGGGFQRLKGGTQNIKHIYDNILMQDSKHIQAALKTKALRELYTQTLKSQDGSLFFSKIGSDAKPVKVMIDQMVEKTSNAMNELGVEVAEGVDTKAEIEKYFEKNTEELMFWSFGNMPKTKETMVDSFIDDNGDRVWIEINKENKLLPDMLDSLDGFTLPSGIAGKALSVAMRVKQLQTILITSMMQFAGPNIIRDQQQAFFLSGGKFKPVVDSITGLRHILEDALGKKGLVSEMKAQGGPGGGRVKTFLEKEWGFANKVDYDVAKPYYHPTEISKNLLNIYVSIADVFEMSTRIGFYARLRKEGVSAREAAWQAREISTDFGKHGSYAPFVLLQRTVPFFGAYVQSVDRDLRGMAEKNGELKFSNLIKTESGKAKLADLKVRMAAIGALYLSIHISLALLGDDEEAYKELTPDQKARFYHYFIGGEHYTIPKPHGLISLFGSLAESITDIQKGQEMDDAKKNMLFALAYHFGIDATPGVINPVAEIALNKTFTGAPVVGRAQEGRSPQYQYSDRTPQLYRKAGELLGMSPSKIQHSVKGYTGYLEEIIAETTEEYFWDEEAWGERPSKRSFKDMVSKQFKPRKVPFRTMYTVNYYELKKKALIAKANFTFAKQQAIKNTKLLEKLSASDIDNVLTKINSKFAQIDKKLISKQGPALDDITYNKKLSGAEKTKEIEAWYAQKNEILKNTYLELNNMIKDVEASLIKINKEK